METVRNLIPVERPSPDEPEDIVEDSFLRYQTPSSSTTPDLRDRTILSPLSSIPSSREDLDNPMADQSNPATLFERSGVEADRQKKEWVVHYLPIDVAELCESLPDYYADNKGYEDFRQAIIALYRGASDERKHSVADVENLVARRAKSPIVNISELSTYYREFFAMTSYLICQGRLSAAEQSCLFVCGIALPLWEQISRRLQLKLPDHYPDDPYTLEQVYNAAKFILHGTLSSASSSSQSANALSGGLVKTEEIAPILRYLVQAIAEQPGNHGYGGNGFAGPRYQLNAPPPPPPHFPNAPYPQQEARPANNNNNFCHYCGNINCRLRTCPFVEEDTRAGRCRHDMDGRVILPNGSYVPRSLPNFYRVTMRDHVFEWNHRNTNAMAPPDQQNAPAAGQPGNQAAQLFFAVAPETPPAVANFHLMTDERISQLDVEVPQHWHSFSRNGPPTNGECDPLPHMSAQAPHREECREVNSGNRPATKSHEMSCERRATLLTDGQGTEERRTSLRATATAIETSQPIEGGQPDSAQHPLTPRPAPEQPESAAYPEHPFAKAHDATYAPPKARNFGAPPAKTKESDRDPAYRTQAPIHDPKVAEEIFAHSMKAPVISLSPEELLSIAPEVRAKYREAVTPKRVPATKTVAFAQFTEEVGEDHKDVDDAKPFLSPFDVLTKSVIKNFNNEDQTITISCPNTGQVATIPTIKRTSGRFHGFSSSKA
ncbi:hypothetical protein BN946_scf185004.g4 [Trametes cinnabarina]|uniref:Uncharacterized protein n=1 Tax=Pycnoporus cinnabarinus TaxID=5643 RepID=A0A060SRN1_PYCCI|nr:hypothetical protein BN946_scf185004.g4 [Trametes cinnabarina]